jgi:hypothetical protein
MVVLIRHLYNIILTIILETTLNNYNAKNQLTLQDNDKGVLPKEESTISTLGGWGGGGVLTIGF